MTIGVTAAAAFTRTFSVANRDITMMTTRPTGQRKPALRKNTLLLIPAIGVLSSLLGCATPLSKPASDFADAGVKVSAAVSSYYDAASLAALDIHELEAVTLVLRTPGIEPDESELKKRVELTTARVGATNRRKELGVALGNMIGAVRGLADADIGPSGATAVKDLGGALVSLASAPTEPQPSAKQSASIVALGRLGEEILTRAQNRRIRDAATELARILDEMSALVSAEAVLYETRLAERRRKQADLVRRLLNAGLVPPPWALVNSYLADTGIAVPTAQAWPAKAEERELWTAAFAELVSARAERAQILQAQASIALAQALRGLAKSSASLSVAEPDVLQGLVRAQELADELKKTLTPKDER